MHRLTDGSRQAIEYYSANLAARPDDLGTRWLLNIAYMTLGEHPHGVPGELLIPPGVFDSEHDIGRFTDRASVAGVATVGLAGGSVVEDLDGDGLLDIAASSWGLDDQMRLYLNRGDGTFVDHTSAAGLTGQVGGLNMNHADYDSDGDRDLLVLRGAWMGEDGLHPNSLLRNDGDATFVDATRQAHLLSFHPTHVAAWSDYDDDGHLDLFVANETTTPRRPHRCELFHNAGDGTFRNTARGAGVDHTGFVKGVAWGDFDNDGRQDLYLSIMNADNVLYRNEGPGEHGWRFTDMSAVARADSPWVSFPTWFWDYDNDGDLDLFNGGYDMTDPGDMARVYLGEPITADHARLYRNDGDGGFTDVTLEVGLHRVILAMGAGYGDLDNDGWLDCYIGTGIPDLRSLTPNRMFRNDRGRYFQDVTTAGGFGNLQKGHGVSFADFDNDGDQDIFEVMGGALAGDVYQDVLYENPGHGNSWLTLRLQGSDAHRDAFGARIRVRVVDEDGEQRDVHVLTGTGGSFGSTSLQQEIGLGRASAIEYVEIDWPGGDRQRFTPLEPNRAYRIVEGGQSPEEVELQRYSMVPDRTHLSHPDH